MSNVRFFIRFASYLVLFCVFAILTLRVSEIRHYYLDIVVSPKVVSLTQPSNSGTGGTGFAVTTPSGKVYTLTNAHVCRLAERGMLVARGESNLAIALLNVLEISSESDLCLLTALPNTDGLSLATSQSYSEQISTIGHPHLEYLTHSQGFATNKQRIAIVVAQNIPQRRCLTEYYGQFSPFSPSPFLEYLDGVGVCIKSYDSVRTSMVVYPGNSGSPVVNMWGNVVGVLFASSDRNNYGYIVPLSNVKRFLSGK